MVELKRLKGACLLCEDMVRACQLFQPVTAHMSQELATTLLGEQQPAFGGSNRPSEALTQMRALESTTHWRDGREGSAFKTEAMGSCHSPNASVISSHFIGRASQAEDLSRHSIASPLRSYVDQNWVGIRECTECNQD